MPGDADAIKAAVGRARPPEPGDTICWRGRSRMLCWGLALEVGDASVTVQSTGEAGRYTVAKERIVRVEAGRAEYDRRCTP